MKHLIIALTMALGLSAGADQPSTHGMLLFGQTRQYISHLPMFHAPHDYQAIAEVTLSPAGQKAYLKDVSEQPADTIYTVVPEKFSLPERFQNGKAFEVSVFRGHFERGGTELFQTKVTVSRVIHFRKLQAGAPKTATQSLLLFGTSGEMFSAHLITGAPDFDQIAQVSAVSLPSADYTVRSQTPNDTPLKAGQSVLFNLQTRLAGELEVIRSVYVEFDDLSG